MINKYFLKLKQSELLRAITILFSGSMIVNVGNYLFYLFLGRFLGPKDFGVFASLISILVIVGIPSLALQNLFAKSSSSLGAKNQFGQIKYLLIFFIRSILVIGLLLTFITWLTSRPLADYLHLPDQRLIWLLSAVWLPILLIPTAKGVLQGLEKFSSLSISMVLEILVKILLGLTLVLAGLRVYGALAAVIASSLLALVYSFYLIKFIFKEKAVNHFSYAERLKPILPLLIASLFFNLFYSLDVILVKHYFSETEAGWYAALSKLGTIIFFITAPIAGVILPMVSRRQAQGRDIKNLLYHSTALVFLIAGAVTIVYRSQPDLVIGILFGPAYLSIKPILWLIGLAMTFLSLNFLLMNYLISLHRFRFLFVFVAGMLLEVVSILRLHNSLKQIIINLIITWGFIFFGLIMSIFKTLNYPMKLTRKTRL